MLKSRLFASAVSLIVLLYLPGCSMQSFPEADFSGQIDAGDDVGGSGGDTTDDDVGDAQTDADDNDASDAQSDSNDDDADAGDTDVAECEAICEGETPICDDDSGSCVACVSDDDCEAEVGTNFARVCDQDNICQVSSDQCAEGFVNVDDSDPDCECQITDVNDIPDGVDTDCDGFDGIVFGDNPNVIFVDPNGGNDSNNGETPGAAVRSLRMALNKTTDERVYVLAAGGKFEEQVTLKDGVGIYGGYDASHNWERNVEDITTAIDASNDTDAFDASTMNYMSVVAEDLASPTVLSHLTIRGVDAQNEGGSSYGVWAYNSDGLRIQNAEIVAGKGKNGRAGKKGEEGKDRMCEADGGAGGDATATEVSGDPTSGDNGTAQAGIDGSGGVLESGMDSPTEAGGGGAGGEHDSISLAVPSLCSPGVGEDGDDGENGAPGNHGVRGDKFGSVLSDGYWKADRGESATDGQNGTGGGGGGAGGSCAYTGDTAIGGNGGHGGTGGCGGEHGENGQPGGASFGIFASHSNLEVAELRITQREGGRGGKGEKGGNGQPKPDDDIREFGKDGDLVDGDGKGGDGGAGGMGADGGDGVGGCGGPSIGVARFASEIDGLSQIGFSDNLPVPSDGGDDSFSSGNAPCAGAVETMHDFGD